MNIPVDLLRVYTLYGAGARAGRGDIHTNAITNKPTFAKIVNPRPYHPYYGRRLVHVYGQHTTFWVRVCLPIPRNL